MNESDEILVKEVEEAVAKESSYLDAEDVSAEVESCPKCGEVNLRVFQCRTGIWEIWARCTNPDCREIFCMGTE